MNKLFKDTYQKKSIVNLTYFYWIIQAYSTVKTQILNVNEFSNMFIMTKLSNMYTKHFFVRKHHWSLFENP